MLDIVNTRNPGALFGVPMRSVAAALLLAAAFLPALSTDAGAQGGEGTPVTVMIDDIAVDNVVNIAEKAAGFAITGEVEGGATVMVTLGAGSARPATVAPGGLAGLSTWTIDIPANDGDITGTSLTVTVTATIAVGNRTEGSVTQNVVVDLVAPDAMYTAPASLTVGEQIAAIDPSGASPDIATYAVQAGILPPGLSLAGATGIITGTPTTANAAMAAVTIRLTDTAGNTADVMIAFPAVVAPVITLSIEGGTAVEGQPVVFTVTLSGTPGQMVSVTYGTPEQEQAGNYGDSAIPGEDYTPLAEVAVTFPGDATGERLTQTFEVATLENDDELQLGEGDILRDEETFTVLFRTSVVPVGVDVSGAESATGTIVEADGSGGLGRVNSAILPHVAQAMVSSTLSAIAGRIDSAASGAPPSRVSGLSVRPGIAAPPKPGEPEHALGTPDPERALGGLSFVLSPDAAGTANAAGEVAQASAGSARAGAGSVVIWGRGDYRHLAGPDDGTIDWDGGMSGFHLGADVRLQPDLLAGLAVSRFSGSFDYTDRAGGAAVKGTYDSRMTGVHPYASWSPSEDTDLWATAGYGEGEIEIAEPGRLRQKSDTEMVSAAVGASHRLLSDDSLIAGGTTTLALRGEGSAASIDVEGREDLILPVDFSVRRLRVALEGRHECAAASPGGCLSPSLDAGLLLDGGDARTGAGLELGGGLRFTAPGVAMEGRGRVLVADGDDHEDWTVGGQLVVAPNADGRGPSFRLAPSYGDGSASAGRLYERGAAALAEARGAPRGRLDAEVGYGFAGGPAGMATPYGGLALAGKDTRNWRAGVRFEAGPRIGFSVEGTRRERGGAAADHGIVARGRLVW